MVRSHKSIGILLVALAFSAGAHGADLKWSGAYRAEYNLVRNFTLNSSNGGVQDTYIIHHLVLEPEVIAMDGLKIHSRFDVFNNALATSTAGQVFGTYSGPTSVTGGGTQPPAVLSETQSPQTIVANALYAEWINEFSSLTFGRVPIQFGLGMTYSNGEGAFDHTLTNKDMIAYKVSMGNLTFMPAIGKVSQGYILSQDEIDDYLLVAEYVNSESDLSMGFMFDQRIAPQDSRTPLVGSDMPLSYFSNVPGVSPVYNGGALFGTAIQDPGGAGFNAYNMNFYVQKKGETFGIGVEMGFTNGYTGIEVPDASTGGFDRVNLSGFGMALETYYKTSDWTFKLYGGMASGDDPDTATFEGYGFTPNYNIAMIMFNYPVGAPGFDALRSTLFGSRAASNSTNTSAQQVQGLDTEVITNAIYAAPQITWAIGENYDLIGTFAWATQLEPSVSRTLGGSASQIGFETDLGFRYHPGKNFQWLTTLGGFLPGSAYSNVAGYPTSMAYGAVSKAAISF